MAWDGEAGALLLSETREECALAVTRGPLIGCFPLGTVRAFTARSVGLLRVGRGWTLSRSR